MNSRKKMIITLSTLCIALLAGIVSIVVVLVSSIQQANSSVNVEFVADRITCELTGTYTIDGETTPFLQGTANKLNITETTQSSSFDSVRITLSSTAPKVIFEYVFTNTSTTIDMQVALNTVPTGTNVSIGYGFYDSYVTNLDNVITYSEYENQVVGASQSKYIYIVVEVEDLMDTASYAGTLQWSLTRAQTYSIRYHNIDSATNINLLNETTKHLKNSNFYEPKIFPTMNNKFFEGWYIESTLTEKVEYPLLVNSDLDLYPKFLDSTILDSHMEIDTTRNIARVVGSMYAGTETTLVIPDIYNGYKVTEIECAYSEFYRFSSFLSANTSVTTVYVSNFVERIPEDFAGWDNPQPAFVSTIFLGRSVKILDKSAIRCASTVYMPSSIRTIKTNALNDSFTSSSSTNQYIQCYDDPRCYVLTKCANNAKYSTIDNYSNVVAFAPEALSGLNETSSSFPQNVETLPAGLFKNNDNITYLSIPNKITYIESNVINGADNVEGIYVSNQNKYYDSRITFETIIETSTGRLISACKNPEIPDGVTIISSGAFASSASSITSLRLPVTVRVLEDSALFNCTSLVNLELPSSLEYIGKDALPTSYVETIESAGGYQMVSCWNDTSKYILLSVNGLEFEDIPNSESIVCMNSKACVNIGYGLFLGNIPSSVKALSWGSFLNNMYVADIALNNVEKIGPHALYCQNLTYIAIPDSVTEISLLAFANYDSLEYICNITAIDISSDSQWMLIPYSETADVEIVTFTSADETANFFSENSTYYEKIVKIAE